MTAETFLDVSIAINIPNNGTTAAKCDQLECQLSSMISHLRHNSLRFAIHNGA